MCVSQVVFCLAQFLEGNSMGTAGTHHLKE